MKLRLNALPPSLSMLDTHDLCLNDFNPKMLDAMNQASNNIIRHFSQSCKTLESFLQSEFNEENINLDKLLEHLEFVSSGPFGYQIDRLKKIIVSVFDKPEVDYQELQSLGIMKKWKAIKQH